MSPSVPVDEPAGSPSADGAVADRVRSGLTVAVHEWLLDQRWFAQDAAEVLEVRSLRSTPLGAAFPMVVWCVLAVQRRDGVVDLVQVFVALGHEVPDRVPDEAIIGEIPGRGDGLMAWSALADVRLALDLCRSIAPEVPITRVQHHVTDRFGTQLIADAHRLAMFPHRLEDGTHPDIEAGRALASDTGPVAAVLGTWRSEGVDMAMLRPVRVPAASGAGVVEQHVRVCVRRGADAAAPTRRDVESFVKLGRALAGFHVASAQRFGAVRSTTDDLADRAGRMWAARNGPRDVTGWAAVERRLSRIAPGTDLGLAVRVHGELDLEALGRERDHWRLHGLGGGTGGAVARWLQPASPLWDVASLLRSIESAAWTTPGVFGNPDASLVVEAWVERAIEAVILGYVSDPDAAALLPADRPSRDALLSICEVIGRMVDIASGGSSVHRLSVSPLGGVVTPSTAR